MLPAILGTLVGLVDLGVSPDPIAIIGGEAAGECVFPSTVAVETSGGLCTGTLVHPRVVVYAAHCGASSPRIRFGQHADVPAFEAVIDHCETNPDYLGASNQAQDWAFCRLEEPVTGIPITPPLYGCETEVIEPGAPVVIAGFGQDGLGFGAGPKRWAATEIVSTFGSTATIGGDGISTCAGDSGSSAFVRLADGGWRAISMVSAGAECESAVHALMHAAVPWIEERSGIDVTPCHDVDGTWNPAEGCGDFYAGDPNDEAAWSDGCAELPRTDPAATCGEPHAETRGAEDDSGGDDSVSDDGASSGDPHSVGEDVGTGTSEAPDDGAAAPTPDDLGASDDGGCRFGRPGPSGLALLAWGWALGATTRRRRAARRGRT